MATPDLATLIQGLGAVAQGFQQGGQQAFANQQEAEQAQRQQSELEMLNQLRGLRAQGLEQQMAPAPQGVLDAFTAQRGVPTGDDATLGQLSTMAQTFPLPEAEDPLLEARQKKIEAQTAAAQALADKRKQGASEQDLTILRALIQQHQNAIEEVFRARGTGPLEALPEQRQASIKEAIRNVRAIEALLKERGIEIPVEFESEVRSMPTEDEINRAGFIETLRRAFGGAPRPEDQNQGGNGGQVPPALE